jgi:hypothetical protein
MFEDCIQQATQQQVETAPPKKQDGTYTNQQNTFIEWVELQVSRNIIPAGGTIYTMEHNVKLYFAEVIGYRADLTPQSAKWGLLMMNELASNATKWEIKDSARVKEGWKHRRDDTKSTWLLL